MDSDCVRQLGEDFVKSAMLFTIGAVIFSSILTGVVVHSITKQANDPKKIEYRKTVESLTPEQKKILGL